MSNGRIIRGDPPKNPFIGRLGTTEYRPSSIDPAMRILRDDIYKLRASQQPPEVKTPQELTLDITVEGDETFNPTPSPSGNASGPTFYGYFVHSVIPIASGIHVTPADKLWLWPFVLPYDAPGINTATWELTTGTPGAEFVGVGLYDANKNLIISAIDDATTQIKTISINEGTVDIPSGFYWLGVTETVGASWLSCGNVLDLQQLVNHTVISWGQSGTTTSGVMPSSFGTITDPVTEARPPIVRFWAA